MKWTTLLAIIPAVALFAIVSAARAEDSMYHANSHHGKGCKPVNATTAADVNARDGYGTDGSKVAPATLGGQSQLVNTDQIDIPLQIPTAKYLEPQAQNAAASTTAATSASTSTASNTTASAPVHNVDVSESFANMGKLSIGQDGSATLNGKPIAQTGDCQ